MTFEVGGGTLQERDGWYMYPQRFVVLKDYLFRGKARKYPI